MMTRVCLVTGAGGLLGEALCRTLAGEYAIVAVYRSTPPYVATQEAGMFDPVAPRRRVPESENPVFTIQADLAAPGEVDRVLELTLARYDSVDVVINAAADVRTSTLTTDPRVVENWHYQLFLNAVVPVQLAAAVAHACWRRDDRENVLRNRNVVNVSSTAGLGQVPPGPGRGFYGASKAALNILTMQMAQEYESMGVRVNALAATFFPQAVRTEHVVRGVRRLDAGRMSGRILIIEKAGNRWL